MDYFTTPETAIKLRDAGFEQPVFKFGQLWMTKDERNWAFVGTGQFELLKQHFLPEIIFRPTAADIIEKLYAASLHRISELNGGGWVVYYRNPQAHGLTIHNSGKHENPAEAAAYLNLKK